MDYQRVVLIGDSHLARVRRDLSLLGERVVNAAVGGASSGDLRTQAAKAGIGAGDVVVVSLGTNDAAPWKHTPLARFEDHLRALLTSLAPSRWILLTPPGVDEEWLTGPTDRTNEVIDVYRSRARAVFAEIGGGVVLSEELIAPLGSAAFVEDGLHLSGRAYRRVLPALRSEADRSTARETAPMSSTIVVAAVAFVRDGQVLTVRKQGTSRFMLVGGKLEPGEDALAAAIRETHEEVGLVVSDLELLGEYVSEAANEPGHQLHSTVFLAPEELRATPVASREIAEVRWIPMTNHPDDLAPMLEHHVLPALRARGL